MLLMLCVLFLYHFNTHFSINELLTFRKEAKLKAGHHCITDFPQVITHCAPRIVDANLHSSFSAGFTSHQSQLPMCARDWSKKQWNESLSVSACERMNVAYVHKQPQHPRCGYSCDIQSVHWCMIAKQSQNLYSWLHPDRSLRTCTADFIQIDGSWASSKRSTAICRCSFSFWGVHPFSTIN